MPAPHTNTVETPMGESETREAIVATFLAPYPTDESYSFVQLHAAINGIVKQIQNTIGPALDDFASTLWSNENGGSGGTLARLRIDAHRVITDTDKILGTDR